MTEIIRRHPPKRILVLGWYGHGNVGDDAFRSSFPDLWPNCEFTFSDRFMFSDNTEHDAVMIGGGSFLDSGIPGIEHCELPIAFVGIGVGKAIKTEMLGALHKARAIVLRDTHSLKHLPLDLAPKAEVVGDLVLARSSFPEWRGEGSKRITLILSEHFIPRGDCTEWQAASWHWFCREMAQSLDRLARDGHAVHLVPMSTCKEWDDRRAAGAVISRMARAGQAYWDFRKADETEFIREIALSDCVVSLRLHGVIFAAGVGCRVVPIIGHDKTRGFAEDAGLKGFDYYACSGAVIHKAITDAFKAPDDRLRQLSYVNGVREKWRASAASVMAKLLP